MDPVEIVARLVEKNALVHPLLVRRLLALAYKTVTLRGIFANTQTYRGATDRFNGEIARTITSSFLHPQRAVMVNVFMPCEMLYAAGINAMFPEGISVYVACTQSSLSFVQAAEEGGIPESFCSYHKLMLGMDARGVLPKTAMIANTTLACDANQLSFRLLAQKSDGTSVPRVVVEVPYVDALSEAALQEALREPSELVQYAQLTQRVQENPFEDREQAAVSEDLEEAVQDVAKQLRAMTKEMEQALGVRVNEDKLVAACEKSYQTLRNMRDYLKIRAHVELPTTLTGELCMLIATHIMAGTEAALEFSNNLLNIAEREAKRIGREQKKVQLQKDVCLSLGAKMPSDNRGGIVFKGKQKQTANLSMAACSAQPREALRKPRKPRIFWMHTLPNWQQAVMDLFETTKAIATSQGGTNAPTTTVDASHPKPATGVSETFKGAEEQRAEIVGNDMAYDFLFALENLNPQDPYDYMARRLLMSSSNGPASRRIACALAAAKESGANGVILFAHWGCRQTAGLAQLAKEAFEKEGIPLLILDGDGCDPRNAPSGQMVTRLEAFIEQLS